MTKIKNNLDLRSSSSIRSNEQKTISCYCPFKGGCIMCNVCACICKVFLWPEWPYPKDLWRWTLYNIDNIACTVNYILVARSIVGCGKIIFGSYFLNGKKQCRLVTWKWPNPSFITNSIAKWKHCFNPIKRLYILRFF